MLARRVWLDDRGGLPSIPLLSIKELESLSLEPKQALIGFGA
jgi:hypothetical protein